MSIELSHEQLQIVDAIRSGANVFMTGGAGTGKTFLLNYIQHAFPEKVVYYTASTGIAAVHISGVTIHAWAGLGTGERDPADVADYILSGRGTVLRRKLRSTDLLIIDEISMLPASLLDMLNTVLKIVRRSTDPFGGIQLVVSGDFFQLPPVVRDPEETIPFSFYARAWQEACFQTHILTTVHRQHDREFIALLRRLRYGALNDADKALLTSRMQVDTLAHESPTILTTHNAHAERLNAKRLTELSTEEHVYAMDEEGKAATVEHLKKNCLAQETLVLKPGAQVMMLKNTYQKDGIINGSIGEVQYFTRKNWPVVTFQNGKTLTIIPDSWSVEEYHAATDSYKTIASISQVPLRLAWAITIHKSQGMTIDYVYCNLQNVFTEGQIYVALSRARSLEGLHLHPFDFNRIRASEEVLSFYDGIMEEEQDDEVPADFATQYHLL